MKRVFQVVLLLVVLFFGFQFISMLFINQHETSYIVKVDDKEFAIKEEFRKKEKIHDYYFEIDIDKHHFAFHNSSNLNKQKQVIKNIEYFDVGNIFCIYPIIEEKNGSSQNDILCDSDNQIVTYSYLKQKNNIYVEGFVQNLQKKEYSNISWDQFNKLESYENLTIYPSNLVKDYSVLVWNYRGIDIINYQSKYTFKVLSMDRYENTHSHLIGKYYMFPNYDEKHDFTNWNLINVEEWDKENFTMEETVSFDSYVNGIVDGELYLIDKDNKRQIAVNPKKQTVREVGNVDTGGTYYDGKWHSKNIYDFINQKLYFNENFSLDAIEKKYGPVDIKKSNQEYYFKTNDGRVYQTFEKNDEEAILLFQDANIVDWKVVDNVIFYLSGSTIYQYDDYTGLKKVIESNEFKYNYENVFEVYKKSS